MTWMARVSLVVCILVSVIQIGGWAFAASTQNRRRIVIFQPGTPLDFALQVVEDSKSSLVHNLWTLINGVAIELPSAGTQLAEDLLQGNPLVQGVYDDTVGMVDGGSHPICIEPAPPPAPEDYPWNMVKIEVPVVQPQWQGAGVTVAILDTGIQASHPELNAQIGDGYNARRGESSCADENGHGTHMAGIIAAALQSPVLTGIVGVAPQITILPVKVLDRYGVGYLSDVINGLQWVYGYDSSTPFVINMSIGWSTDIPPLKQAIQELFTSGVIMVASAGNPCAQSPAQDEGVGGDDCEKGPALICDPSQTAVKYPAGYPEVLAVGATGFDGQTTAYSLSGPELAVLAPGGAPDSQAPDNGQILSTTTGGGYGYGSGTSQAAAHVSGAVALALQLCPGLSFQQVRQYLQETAQATNEWPDGPRRINVDELVQALLDDSCP